MSVGASMRAYDSTALPGKSIVPAVPSVEDSSHSLARAHAHACLSSCPYLSVFSPDGKISPEFINKKFPIIGIKLHQGAIQIIRRNADRLEIEFDKERPEQDYAPLAKLVQIDLETGEVIEKGKRGEIAEWSKKSRGRMAFACAAAPLKWRSMLTVTYGEIFPKDGAEVRKDRNNILTALRRRLGADVAYFWFLEFQKRGAPHVHILLDVTPTDEDRVWWAKYWTRSQTKTLNLPTEEQEKIFRFNAHPDTWQEAKHEGGLRRYGLKYALKMEQKTVPEDYRNVGRFWAYKGPDIEKDGVFIPYSPEDTLDLVRHFRPEVAEWDILPKYVLGIDMRLGDDK